MLLRLLLLLIVARTAFAFGPAGHELVGAVADQKLKETPAGRAVRKLLGNVTLARAATVADDIKLWDRLTPGDQHSLYAIPAPLTDALWQFWLANPPPEQADDEHPSHHWFHYTDVPLSHPSYAKGTRGRSRWDLVQMTGYCAGVLQGTVPEDNPRKITKPIAILLLAHFIGDIHQPLHVGAEYFLPDGTAADPDAHPEALEDRGGNTLTLRIQGQSAQSLHKFWDSTAVGRAFESLGHPLGSGSDRRDTYRIQHEAVTALAPGLAIRTPDGWQEDPSTDPAQWARNRADAALPLAREAHKRLTFQKVIPSRSRGHPVAQGDAREAAAADGLRYTEWAATRIQGQLHHAGWRLAELLTHCLR